MARTARRRRGPTIAIVLLAIALVAAAGAVVLLFVQLAAADARFEQQQREIDRLTELVEKKETFGAAMDELLVEARTLDGVLTASLVPLESYEALAQQAWDRRWDAAAMDTEIVRVENVLASLRETKEAARLEASTNASGTMYEEVTDRLGEGFVASDSGDADTFCGADVLGCVSPLDPYTVHFDAAENSAPYMTDWLRTGLAYHEFAHVLQFTNPGPTQTALLAFDGDHEAMADCFALTYLEGWTLDHRIWQSPYEYWDVSIGYGYACSEAQAQAVRDWYGQLGVRVAPISQ